MSAAVMGVVALLPGMPMLPFLVLAGGAGALAYVDWTSAQAAEIAEARPKTADEAKAPPAEEPIADRARDRRPQDRARLRPAAADQRRRTGRPPHRPDQGAAPPAGERDRLRHAGGAHPRQYAARAERATSSGSRRSRPAAAICAWPVSWSWTRRGAQITLPGDAHHRAGLRPARHLDRRRAARGSRVPRLHRRRSRDRAHHAPDRGAQGQHVASCSPTPRCRSC